MVAFHVLPIHPETVKAVPMPKIMIDANDGTNRLGDQFVPQGPGSVWRTEDSTFLGTSAQSGSRDELEQIARRIAKVGTWTGLWPAKAHRVEPGGNALAIDLTGDEK
jgi:hypothetical protein